MTEQPKRKILMDQETETKEEVSPMYKVLCHDDPHTEYQFVVELLVAVFRLPRARATELTDAIDSDGFVLVGLYPRALAKKKILRAQNIARAASFPLAFSMERA